MGNTQYSKATKETAENLRIIDDANECNPKDASKRIQQGNREMILSLDYSETELETAEKELLAQG